MHSVISTPMHTLLMRLLMWRLWRHVPLLNGARNRFLLADVERHRTWAREFLTPLFDDVLESGSSVICNPPVVDTDVDFFVLFDCVRRVEADNISGIRESISVTAVIKYHAINHRQCYHGFRGYEALAPNSYEELHGIISKLRSHGFRMTSDADCYNSNLDGMSHEFEGLMICFRKDRINLIILFHPEIFMRYRIATQMAKAKNITNKSERVKFFNAIVAGKTEVERVVFGKNPGWRTTTLQF